MIAMSTPQNGTNRAASAISAGSPQKPPIARPSTSAAMPATAAAAASAAGRSMPHTTAASKMTTTKDPTSQPSAAVKTVVKDDPSVAGTSAGVNKVASSAVPTVAKTGNGSVSSAPNTTHASSSSNSSNAIAPKPVTPSPALRAEANASATTSKPQPSALQRSSTASSSTSTSTASASTSQPIGSLLGIHDLEAVAQAAMGLDANGNPLPGNEESHRSLAEAVKRLSAMQNSGYARATGNYVQASPQQQQQQQSYAQQQDSQQYSHYAQQMEYNSDGSPMKRFQCHLCDRAFARAYNLNTHLATHDPDPNRSKPFPCPYASCKADGGRSFSRKHDLQRHVASTHENEQPPEDEEIDENGERISTLVKLGLGTPGRKFRCDECGRAFVRRDALKRHQCMPAMASTPPPPQQQQQQSRPSANGTGPSSAASMSGPIRPMKAAEAPAPGSLVSNYSASIPAGLSLYTSTAPTHTKGSSTAPKMTQPSSSSVNNSVDAAAPPPFYPTGLTYESLTREVQDMAMQLVAQASTYNQAHTSPPDKGGPSAGGTKAMSNSQPPPSSSSSSSSSASSSAARPTS